MEKRIINFKASGQSLQRKGGIVTAASDTVNYFEAHFDLDENWQSLASVRALWSNGTKTVSAVLIDGVCKIPADVLTDVSKLKVNLVGSTSENEVLTDRLTTFPCPAFGVTVKVPVDGSDPQPITPSEFEQFVEAVKADADRAEESATASEESAQDAANSAIEAHDYAEEAKTDYTELSARVDEKMPIVEYGDEVVVFDTVELAFAKDGDNAYYCTAENPIQGFTRNSFVYDAIYKVVWDGVEYDGCMFSILNQPEVYTSGSTTFVGTNDWGAIGNAAFLNNSINIGNTDVPFCIAFDYHRNSSEVQIFTTSTEASHTVKLIKKPYTKTIVPKTLYQETYENRPSIFRGTGNHSTITSGATESSGWGAHAEGGATIASGQTAHAEGTSTVASGMWAHAEGGGTSATGKSSHAEGWLSEATAEYAHAEGRHSIASGKQSHSEGATTTASGNSSHAEGQKTQATQPYAHAEGNYTIASANATHVEGDYSVASDRDAHAEGDHTIANRKALHVSGKYNVADPTTGADNSQTLGIYAEIIGNGADEEHRSNARALDWQGNERLMGDVYVGCEADSTGGSKLAKESMLEAILPTETASGSIASFPDGQTVFPVKSLVATIEPKQEGSGTPSPENIRPISGWTGVNITRTGKNIFDGEWESGYINTNNGQPASGGSNVRPKHKIFVLPSKTYAISHSSGNRNIYWFTYKADGSFSRYIGLKNTASSTIATNADEYYLWCYQYNNTSAPSNMQIEISPKTDYEPYTGQTYPVSWQSEAGTVYGGYIDVVSGTLVATMAKIEDMSTLRLIKELVLDKGLYDIAVPNKAYGGNFICSCYESANVPNDQLLDKQAGYRSEAYNKEYVVIRDDEGGGASHFQEMLSGQSLVYELETPQTYQLTPTEVMMLLGENRIWADCGDVNMTYKADIQKWVEKKLS